LLPSMERLGAGVAIVLSGVVFALMHGNLAGFPAHLLLGILLGLLAWGTDCLWVPMLFHFVYNGFLTWISYRVSGIAQDATYYVVTQADILMLCAMAMILLAVWAFFLYGLLRHASVETQPAPRKGARWPFWAVLAVLLTLQAANYGVQFLLLSSAL
ncbi:MAG TPA: CPBP family glutamic-type intramembrane protease, partial [Clostridia bacterium]|nr:CPBP family glutamic-type intramembrane protease [Clostridia bacterium]